MMKEILRKIIPDYRSLFNNNIYPVWYERKFEDLMLVGTNLNYHVLEVIFRRFPRAPGRSIEVIGA